MSTIKEVARKAGVSVATVSYVLNEVRKVRPATEQRVLRAARELEYRPNSAARSLAAGRSTIVGLVVPDIGNPFFPEITCAFEDAANACGMESFLMNSHADPRRTRTLIERLLCLQVPGAAFLTSQVEPEVKAYLARRNVAAVYMDHGEPGERITSIAVDYRHGMLQAFDHLVRLGHRKIGLIGGPANGAAARLRKAAFLEGADTAAVEPYVIDSDFTAQGGYFSCSKLLREPGVTAIMAANDLMAIGALHCACDRGIAVPSALSLTGFDNIGFSQFTQPALTTVAVPREEIGCLAFQALRSLISDPQRPGEVHPVATSLVLRQSTAPPP